MALQGNWFDGKTSASKPVEIRIDSMGEVCVIDTQTQLLIVQVPFAQIKISSRIGNTPRYLYFPDGQKGETQDNALLDQWQQQYQPSFWYGLAHRLESHIYFVALTLVFLIVFSWAMIVYGLPSAARYLAFKLPASVMDRAATETIQLLDKTGLGNTQLDQATQTRILTHFAPAIEQNKNLHINVIFRHGGKIGANAFALPDGTVLFTDEIVHLAKNDDELLSVLAHEIGHVKYRHSLRAAIQGSVISFGVVMVTGDLSAVSNMLASLPVVLTNMSYSRNFEREADDNSLVFLDANNIARHHFVDLMERLTYQGECQHWLAPKKLQEKLLSGAKSSAQSSTTSSSSSEEEETASIEEKNESVVFDIEAHRTECDKLIAKHKDDFFNSKLVGYFASHPETDERTAKFKN